MTKSNIIIRRRQSSNKVNPDTVANIVVTPNVSHESDVKTAETAPEEKLADRTNEPLPGESFGTEFLDNLAHQMVAPLQAIERQCSNILEGYISGDDVNKRLKEVIGHTKILTELARRMRFLHQLVDGSLVGPEQLTFETVTKQWIDGFNNYLPFLQDRGITTDIDCDNMNSLPNVYASRLAVHQVVMNLFDNSMKYGAEDSAIRVFATRRRNEILNTFEHKAKVKLTEIAATKMFERGFRSDEAMAIRAAGTGLGMNISRALMRAMGGDLIAYPTDAKNTTRFVLQWRVVQ